MNKKRSRLTRIFARRRWSPAERKQERALTLAASLSAQAPIETASDKAFWCGVNYAMNDLWSMTIGGEPVFLKEFWGRLEEALVEDRALMD